MKKIVILLSAFAFLAVSSCQTMTGLGRDLTSAGQKLQNAANR
ncbi:MAG: entericidin A/B family lipoprotein [Akkermansiaceae bacterium]|nr:entericidin A/B family lipoprotein [Akkermansiaceae bacterium]